MALSKSRTEVICASSEVSEGGSRRFAVVHRGEPREAILVRIGGSVFGYLNQCVHMPRELDCEHCHVFDETGRFLRCTMHGITYRPETGECLSEICAGKSLTPLRVTESDGAVILCDKRTRLQAAGTAASEAR